MVCLIKYFFSKYDQIQCSETSETNEDIFLFAFVASLVAFFFIRTNKILMKLTVTIF